MPRDGECFLRAPALLLRKIQPMPENATYPTLRDELAREGGDLLVSVLRDMLRGKVCARFPPLTLGGSSWCQATSHPQASASSAPKAPFITAEDTHVDFASMSADQIFSRFRALSHQVGRSASAVSCHSFLLRNRYSRIPQTANHYISTTWSS
jgi:methionyl-tRNA formyltransferase